MVELRTNRVAPLSGAAVLILLSGGLLGFALVAVKWHGPRSLFARGLALSSAAAERNTLHQPRDDQLPSKVLPTNAGVNSLPGTTGPGVPHAVRAWLLQEGITTDERALSSYGALEDAAKAKEGHCGWSAQTSNFAQSNCTASLHFQAEPEEPQSLLDPREVDIVTASIRDLDFLERWREFFQGFHVIIIQDGDPDKLLKVPEWVDFELYNRHDIERALGADQWIIGDRDASIRNFGFLVSKKRFIYSIDETCLPARDAEGFQINPLAVHVRNLKTPSTPFYFNTLYDPYAVGSDFVRGYPYSLRGGVPTAVSHGLWLGAPDYDAPTHLLKVAERNTRLVDTTMTIPHGQLYSMSSMNVAFVRETIGPAFMQGLRGTGLPVRYDDVFAGWASKVVSDHLALGVKSGQPYIRHDNAPNPFRNLHKEYKGLWWQEEVIRFMSKVALPREAKTAAAAYRALAGEIRRVLTPLHAYFGGLASAMEVWVNAWERAEGGALLFTPNRSRVSREVPVNLGERSFRRASPGHVNLTLFGRLASPPANVTKEDRAIAGSWATYVYPLPPKFHADVMKWYDRGCLLETCSDEAIGKKPPQYQDHAAEVVILSKLLSSLRLVEDPEDADLFLVPALPVVVVIARCRNRGKCDEPWYKELFHSLPFLHDPRKLHLFLATQDFNQNHRDIVKLTKQDNVLLANYGPGGLVVPALNTATSVQHGTGLDVPNVMEKPIFIMANYGLRSQDRRAVNEQLQKYNGTRRIVKPGDKWTYEQMHQSVFTVCLGGDLPHTKRFFDAVLHFSIPVAIEHHVQPKGVNAPFRTFWQIGSYYSHDIANHSVEATFPDIRFTGVTLDDFVVVMTEKESKDTVKALEKVYSDREGMERRMKALQKVRNYFLYNLKGDAPDAFTAMLMHVASRVHSS